MSMIISNAVLNAAQTAAAAGVKGTPEVQRPEEEGPVRSPKPAMDEYIPEEKREPSGRYWLEKDENGQPKVCFDAPAQDKDGDGPETKAADGPGKKAETCTASTDKVDRDLETLKKEREQLKQQLGSETDETKRKALKEKLAKVEAQLRQKDNDAYRRQHTVFS